VLKRLEEKGHLTHTVDNRTFIYKGSETPGRAAARAVKRIVDRFCGGSVEEVLVGLIDTKVLDRRELQRLADKIAKAKAADAESRGEKDHKGGRKS
jgi:predicted transcriptional regulator